ncbi:MAG: uracil-DNA glycosylase [Alphaproteobacteria bacterium]|nr:uracil-DNA glycosylase [Alphaproteobacteria bacterium]
MEKEDFINVLQWYHENGVDVATFPTPQNRFAKAEKKPESSQAVVPKIIPRISSLTDHPARSCQSLEELKSAMADFSGCGLKETAMNLVFSDGNPQAKIMFVGEAPGADEDKQGKPFVGQCGQLLDKIFASINLDRTKIYISNIVPWRPPGNRPPTTGEIALCQPFIEKHIELINPKILVLLGGVAAKTLLSATKGIAQLRGEWHTYHPTPDSPGIKTIATFHPAYLMRSPGQKALVWRDFLMIEDALKELGPL